ncbi:MAG: hypothetical protein JWR90_3290 [Marmoricola sp.]|nr:hypothetical protein [Marmoricola sp.]
MTFCVLAAGCSSGPEKAAPPPSPTPIARLNTAAIQLPRIEFCPLVPASATKAALGGRPSAHAAYGNGDEEALPGVGTDAVHEIGCSWTKGATTARAWVFARPISPVFALTVVASGRRTPGCRTVAGPAYGQPSATQVCQRPGGSQRVRHSGLFGQTWLSCELESAEFLGADLRSRADAWCVEIANALNTAR